MAKKGKLQLTQSLGADDTQRLANWEARYQENELVQFKSAHDGSLTYDGHPVAGALGIVEAMGTSDLQLGKRMLGQVAATFSDGREPTDDLNDALAALHPFKAQDVLEGQLACQMLAVHNAAMRFMGMAAKSTDSDRVARNVDWATKMLRTYTAQLEALNRYRGKGQQKVTVEHVTVNDGGQAIVGNVAAARQGKITAG